METPQRILKTISQVTREKSFKLKTDLASFDIHDSPPEMTERLTNISEEFVDLSLKLTNQLVSAIDESNRAIERMDSLGDLSCPNCGSVISRDDLFCGECRMKLPPLNKCPECSANVDLTAKYCSKYGIEFGENTNNLAKIDQIDSAVDKAHAEMQSLDEIVIQINTIAEKGSSEMEEINKAIDR